MTTGQAEKNQKRREPPMRTGVVVSDKRDKSVTVMYEYSVRHPKYGKYLRRSTRLQVHDANNEAHTGDRVEVAFCRRISKTKNWRLVRILTKAPQG